VEVRTLIATIVGLLLLAPLLSVTLRENLSIKLDDNLGALKNALIALLLFNTTFGPAICVHE